MTELVLTLYTRKDCHLCDEMHAGLKVLQAQLDFALELVDVDDDPTLVSKFDDKVPVLMHGEREICHYFLDESALFDCLSSETR